MYRILIADDEGIMLESIKNIIMKSFPEEFEVSTAKTGRSAIEQAEFLHPDIVFMDIHMPGINGIQAMQEIRKFNQTALFYVITAYDKFDYAKDAIEIGVERYLTKPVSKATVIEVVREAMQKVEQMRQKRSEQLKVQEKLETIVPVVENGFVSNILIQTNWKDMEYYRQLLDITEENGYVCVFQFGTQMEDGKLVSPVGASVQAQDFSDEFRAILKSYLHCLIGNVISDRIVVAVPCGKDQNAYETRVAVIEQMRQIVARLEQRLPMKFRAGIGRIRPLEELRASYQEAVLALQENEGHIVHTDDVSGHGYYEGEYPAETERRMFVLLDRGDVEGMRIQANSFYDWMVEQYPGSRDNIRLKVLEYVLRAERDAFKVGAVNYGFSFRENYLTEVMRFDDYEQLRAWFLEKMNAACSRIRDRQEEQSETVVSKAMLFLNENYRKDISLDDVSREVNVSPYYFSKLFKEESGRNFIEYLTDLRMEHAKDLLAAGSLSVKEISQESGYADPNYFSRIFKKHTGMTPREYRDSFLAGASGKAAEDEGDR